MKICVVTMFSPAYRPIADITLPVLKSYCEKHNYQWEIICVPDWDYSYRKHEYLKEKMKWDIDVFFYIDIDALITNPEIKIENFIDDEHDLFVCEDVNEVNGGVFILKNTEWAKEFNEFVLAQKAIQVNEQNVYVLCKDDPKIKLLKHPSINSYPYEYYPEYKNITHEQGNWERNDFICHVPGKSLSERIEILNKIKDAVTVDCN